MEEKYWKQFENSGRIEDYLTFVSGSGRETGDAHMECGQMKEGSHAGIYNDDRNRTEANPGGGI